MRAEPDKLPFGGEPQEDGPKAGKLGTGYRPHSLHTRHPRVPPLIPRKGRVLFSLINKLTLPAATG